MKLKDLENVLGDRITEITVCNGCETFTINLLQAKKEMLLLNAIFGGELIEFQEADVNKVFVNDSGFSIDLDYTPETLDALYLTAHKMHLNIVHTIYDEQN